MPPLATLPPPPDMVPLVSMRPPANLGSRLRRGSTAKHRYRKKTMTKRLCTYVQRSLFLFNGTYIYIHAWFLMCIYIYIIDCPDLKLKQIPQKNYILWVSNHPNLSGFEHRSEVAIDRLRSGDFWIQGSLSWLKGKTYSKRCSFLINIWGYIPYQYGG